MVTGHFHILARQILTATVVVSANIIPANVFGADLPTPTSTPHFESHVRPIFREYCFDCHGANAEVQADLDLRLVRFLLRGGESGPAIQVGHPESSHLLRLVQSGEMPPGEARVPPEKIAILQQWIAAGAPTLRPEPESIGPGVPLSQEDRSYWAYQPIRRPPTATPITRSDPGHHNVIDGQLATAMPAGLTFAPEADRLTLIKRAYFDLIGLPPNPDEIAHWQSMARPTWFDEMLDLLLSSHHYGERWARHWLDVAGYADSDGYNADDVDRPWAWKYRDYVIRSLNADKPLDQFVIEQLAGDELAGPRQGDWTANQIELLTATGFLRTSADGTGSGDDTLEARNKVVSDSLKIVGTALLGTSLHCAQCHDHRYDPISQLDYVALRSVFEPALDCQNWKTPPSRTVSLYTAEERVKATEIEAAIQGLVAERQTKQDAYLLVELNKELQKQDELLREPLRKAQQTPAGDRTNDQVALLAKYPSVDVQPGTLYLYSPQAAEELTKIDQKIAEMRSKKPVEEHVRLLDESPGNAPLARLFHRGEFQQPLQEVFPAGLTVTEPEGQQAQFPLDDPALPTTGRRLAFAKWLTGPSNPLLARVLVNRMWLHHFGTGIVPTPGEFGKLGSPPTHPELLDRLAAEFVEQGWSLKRLHRTIMTSAAWRQQAKRGIGQAPADRENRFYGRRSLQRLDAEIVRDRMLTAADRLNRTALGPTLSIKVDNTGQIVVDGSQTRRSVYIRSRRSQPVAMLQAFDAPVMETNCEMRPVSTVATQSLIMLNGEFTLEQAGHLADTVLRHCPTIRSHTSAPAAPAEDSTSNSVDVSDFVVPITYAWERALCRRPQPEELEFALSFVAEQLAELHRDARGVPENRTPEAQVLVNICQILFNSNEFLYVD